MFQAQGVRLERATAEYGLPRLSLARLLLVCSVTHMYIQSLPQSSFLREKVTLEARLDFFKKKQIILRI